MIYGIDYKFEDDLKDENPTIPFTFLKDPYKGVSGCLGTVRIEEQEDGGAILHFTFKIISDHQHLAEDEDFKDHISKLLHHLIQESIDDTREDYTEELNNE